MEEEAEVNDSDDLLSFDKMIQIREECEHENAQIIQYYAERKKAYEFVIPSSGKIFFDVRNSGIIDDYEHEHRLKFHISLPEWDHLVNKDANQESQELYKKGWDIIKDVLIKHKVNHFKICNDVTRMSQEDVGEGIGSQRGKDVTIYAMDNASYAPEQWQKIIYEITENLVNAGIPPGYKTIRKGDRADRTLQGNNYVSYRYEGGAPKNDYFATKREWPKGQLDNIKWDDDKNCCCVPPSGCTIL